MSSHDTEKPTARYTLRPTFTPLPHEKRTNGKNGSEAARNAAQTPAGGADDATRTVGAHSAARQDDATNAAASGPADAPYPSHRATNSTIRAANEDDDLYDPYSDYHDGTLRSLEFERDPWR